MDPTAKVDSEDEIVRAAKARSGTPYLNTAQAAHYLRLSEHKLKTMRRKGGGPQFRKHGKPVVYHIDDLDGWSLKRKRTTIDDLQKALTPPMPSRH